MANIVKVTVWVPDQKALSEVLQHAKLQVGCGAPKRDFDGTFKIDFYGSDAEATKLKGLGFKIEVDDKYGAVLETRREEVSKIDRFQGGKIKPDGLGIKA